MAPLVRRSWSPRGRTPVLTQRTRSHQKVSVIAALCVAPDKKPPRLYFRLHPDANINATSVREFLSHLLKQRRQPLMLVWDRLLAHRARTVQGFIQNHPRLHSDFLPAYAPELNPVEYLWSYLKMNPMANAPFLELDALTQATRRHGRSLQRKPNLLLAFLNHSPLFTCQK